MAYMRGDYYIYEGGDGIHIYTKDGLVTVPSPIFNALVMMRIADMTKKEKQDAIKLAINRYSGNFGVDPLRKKCGMDTMFDTIKRMFANPIKEKQHEKCKGKVSVSARR